MVDDNNVITFEGSQTIEKAEEIKKTLLTAFKGKTKKIVIDLSKIEKIDSSFLQLLYSATLEAKKKKKKIFFNKEIPESVIDIVNLSGFDNIFDDNPLS